MKLEAPKDPLLADFFEGLTEEAFAINEAAATKFRRSPEESSVLILGSPGFEAAVIEPRYHLDALALLFDRIILVDPWTGHLVPQDDDTDRQFAEKLGVLCENQVILTLISGSYSPLESWAEEMALRACIPYEWGSFVRLQYYRQEHMQEYPHWINFCELWDSIFESQLQRDKTFSKLYQAAYSLEEDEISHEVDRPRWGFWDLKRSSLTPYILSHALGTNIVHNRGILTTYADAVLNRLEQKAFDFSDSRKITNSIGDLEVLIPLLESITLRIPFSLTPDELLKLRESGTATELRSWLGGRIRDRDVTSKDLTIKDLVADFNGLTSSVKSSGLLADLTISSLMTSIGYLIGDLGGALVGNLGAITIKNIAEQAMTRVRARKLRWVYDIIDLRPGNQ